MTSSIRSAKNFSLIGLLFASLVLVAPLYVWRFSVDAFALSLPTNFLMLYTFGIIASLLVIVIFQRDWQSVWQSVKSLNKYFLIGIGLFSLASVISLFYLGVTAEKLSQWVVLYLQPITIFFLYNYFSRSSVELKLTMHEYVKLSAYLVIAIAGVLALVQYFTLFTLPAQWQGNSLEPKRAIAFFAHANAYGLFVTPLLAWLIPDLVKKLQARKYFYGLLWAVGGLGVLLSLSRGAWIGLLSAFGLFVLLNASKKLIFGFIVAMVLLAGVVAAIPNLRYRVLLPFYGEKSAVARLSLWNTGFEMIKDSPVLGKGVNGFKDNWEAYNKDAGLEHYNFAHNIFINFWIDSGLLGLLSMLIIVAYGILRGLRVKKAIALSIFFVAIVLHGLIDIPYFKNDLALIFWLIIAAEA